MVLCGYRLQQLNRVHTLGDRPKFVWCCSGTRKQLLPSRSSMCRLPKPLGRAAVAAVVTLLAASTLTACGSDAQHDLAPHTGTPAPEPILTTPTETLSQAETEAALADCKDQWVSRRLGMDTYEFWSDNFDHMYFVDSPSTELVDGTWVITLPPNRAADNSFPFDCSWDGTTAIDLVGPSHT